MSGDSDTNFAKALDLLDNERFFEAITAFSECIALDPESEGAYGNRGLAYLNLGMDELALSDFERVLCLNPDDSMGHAMMAEALRQTNRHENALRCAVKSLELNEDEPQAYFVRGWLFARAGQYEQAKEDLERFVGYVGEQEAGFELLECCRTLSHDKPIDDAGLPIKNPQAANIYLGRRGWSFDLSKNDDYEAQGLPCAYAHCIRNLPPLSPVMPGGCSLFGHACPGGDEQVDWCRMHPPEF